MYILYVMFVHFSYLFRVLIFFFYYWYFYFFSSHVQCHLKLFFSCNVCDVCVLDMAPYYETLCKELKWSVDSDLLSKMKKANEGELKRLDEVLEDAEKNLGESEIRDAMMAKAEYLIRIGDKVSEEI